MSKRIDLVKAIKENEAHGAALKDELKQMDDAALKAEQDRELHLIKALWDDIPSKDRTGFIKGLSKELNVPFFTIRTNWFSRWDIPVKYKVRENLIKYMKNYIANKNNALV